MRVLLVMINYIDTNVLCLFSEVEMTSICLYQVHIDTERENDFNINAVSVLHAVSLDFESTHEGKCNDDLNVILT